MNELSVMSVSGRYRNGGPACRVRVWLGVGAFCVLAGGPAVRGQGMPPEARDAIHALFDGHGKIERKVELTEDGYVAVTESSDPELAKVLRRHVRQMEDRLESGLMVRRWDPAFEEYVNYYDEIEHEIRRTERGLRIVVKGLTPEGVKVARNHAKAVTDFVNRGWEAHDTEHAAALAAEGEPSIGRPARGRGFGPGRGMGRGPRAAAPEPREDDAASAKTAEGTDGGGECEECEECEDGESGASGEPGETGKGCRCEQAAPEKPAGDGEHGAAGDGTSGDE